MRSSDKSRRWLIRILSLSLVSIHRSTKSPLWLTCERYPAARSAEASQVLGTKWKMQTQTLVTEAQNASPASSSPCNLSRLWTSRVLGRPFNTEELPVIVASSPLLYKLATELGGGSKGRPTGARWRGFRFISRNRC